MKHLKSLNINSILFLDIETAPNWEKLQDAPERVRKEWIYKFKFSDNAPDFPNPEKNQNATGEFLEKKYYKYFDDLWEKKAGLFAEFSKIIVISMGYQVRAEARVKSYFQENEADLLDAFKEDLAAFTGAVKGAKLCAHFGNGFDYPFICKRMLIHGLTIPDILDVEGLKPWETNLLDTQNIWKFGSYSAASGTLSSIAMAFGLPSPKDDIEGADVARVYYAGGLERIARYCEKDVFTLINVFKRMRGEAPLIDIGQQKLL